MGISGLLPLLKKASKNCHVRKLSGSTAAIDGYCWLHKGAFGCAQKLGMGEPTDAYITYCMKYIQVLLDNQIKPVVVLDGRSLPSKEVTNSKRREHRKKNKELARKYLQQGKKKEAWECFTKSVDITPEMSREFIKVLRKKKIDYVVAPYEADAQLAYLAKSGIVDFVITEDSDLVLFGCPKILFKMNVNGDGVFFDRAKLPQCFGMTQKKFNFDHFRWMCILSGCDYLESMPGIGLGRAKKVLMESNLNHNDIRQMLLSIPSILVKVQVEITEDYIDGFIQAENTFLYQLVFDTTKRILLPLTPYPAELGPEDMPYAGSYATQKIAVNLALGNIDIISLKTVDKYEPTESGYTKDSIWYSSFTPPSFDIDRPFQPVGMEISSPTQQSKSQKKRPLAVLNSDNEDNGEEDTDLMSMYAADDIKPARKVGRPRKAQKPSVCSSDDEAEKADTDVKPVIKSPSTPNKRRRVAQQNSETENVANSPSANLRSRSRSRSIPFLKSSPATTNTFHVKSQYFKSAEAEVKVKKEEAADDSSTASEEEFMPAPPPLSNLNIYSYESSSQDSALVSDISASSRQSTPQKSASASRSVSAESLVRPCSVVIKKNEIPEITIEDEEEDDDTTTKSHYFSQQPASRNKSPIKRVAAKTPLLSVATKSSCRRQGLSRSAKKTVDPKQRSVRDMFARHKSVQ